MPDPTRHPNESRLALTPTAPRLTLKFMEFKVSDLEKEPIEFDLQLKPGSIDFGIEATQDGPLAASGRAEVIHEHRGPKDIVADIRLRGQYSGEFQLPCARCVEPVKVPLAGDYDLIFRPVGADADAPERSITAPETEIGYYQEDSLLLEDVLREQVLLSLPVRTLCKADCKGLCPRCGTNRNLEACTCEEGSSDPRWEALAGLRSRIKS
ncbi:MAG: YceD family protein [Terracidiphilus sp.]